MDGVTDQLLLPRTWRSIVRIIVFVSSMVLLAALVVGGGLPTWLRVVCALAVLVGLREIVDYAICARHWRVEGDDVHLPRLGDRDRVMRGVATTIDLDPRTRSTLLRVVDDESTRLIPANILVSPRDIRRWLRDFPVES
ncbi:MAG: hypothetical protein QNJ12_20645 [Ilumatobacter sp.]|uniref:hypothetical protein n=1 Tax=Ilumatobacter sp. TaxID=1967498 RepID=UPI002620983B|nr:hypothetical protein [Ilumatobacter sp.]MDJ0771209.1 hypothetical protein [Ilumatobacter sp.]